MIRPPDEREPLSSDDMKAVLLDVPEALLAQRRADGLDGLDGLDEVWDGVLHMAPPPGDAHQEVAAELVIEILSTYDETDEKLEWYADRGVREVLVVGPDERTVELYRAAGSRLVAVEPQEDGVWSQVLRAGFVTCQGHLRVAWADGSVDI